MRESVDEIKSEEEKIAFEYAIGAVGKSVDRLLKSVEEKLTQVVIVSPFFARRQPGSYSLNHFSEKTIYCDLKVTLILGSKRCSNWSSHIKWRDLVFIALSTDTSAGFSFQVLM